MSVPGEQQWDIVSSVGITALAVAGGRARESQRSDRLIDDPLAEPLVQAAGSTLPLLEEEPPEPIEPMLQAMTEYLGVRSRFFDEYLQRAADAGVRQVVILAAGLDTRGFRLEWPAGMRLFEVDQPRVLEFKQTVLDEQRATAGCTYAPLGMDLRHEWAGPLREAGFDPSQPSAWLAEGLLPYLPAAAEEQLLRTVHDLSAPGSRIAIEYTNANPTTQLDTAAQEQIQQWGIDLADLLNPEPRPDCGAVLGEHGWHVHREPATTVAAQYGRDISGFLQLQGPDGQFLTAQQPD